MKADIRFMHKWMLVTVSVAIFVLPVFECAVAQETILPEALYADRLPWSDGRALASLHISKGTVTARRAAIRESSAASAESEHLMPKPDAIEGYEGEPRELTGLGSLDPALAESGEVIPFRGDTQPLLGIGWDHDAGGFRKWNIALGFGFYFSNDDRWRYLAEGFGPEETPSVDRRSDLFEKIRTVLEVIGFKIRYDF